MRGHKFDDFWGPKKFVFRTIEKMLGHCTEKHLQNKPKIKSIGGLVFELQLQQI